MPWSIAPTVPCDGALTTTSVSGAGALGVHARWIALGTLTAGIVADTLEHVAGDTSVTRSAELNTAPDWLSPPAMIAPPLIAAAAAPSRAVCSCVDPVAGTEANVPVAGSNSSTLESAVPDGGLATVLCPPAIRILPLGSAVAVASSRGVCSSVLPEAGRAVKVLNDGLKISALWVTVEPLDPAAPPAISTEPPGSSAATAPYRATVMLDGSELKVSVTELNSSALDTIVLASFPPAINTSLLIVGAATAPARGTCSSVLPEGVSSVKCPDNGL